MFACATCGQQRDTVRGSIREPLAGGSNRLVHFPVSNSPERASGGERALTGNFGFKIPHSYLDTYLRRLSRAARSIDIFIN